MLNLERIFRQERLLRAMTGLNQKAFDELLLNFTRVYEQNLFEREKPRARAIGGGRKAVLETTKAKLFYVLFYCKCYPTFDLASVLCNFDRSQAHYWVHRLMPLLEKTLGEKMVLPERKIATVEEFSRKFPQVKRVAIDGTERVIRRPKAQEKQTKNYSGKKKKHTRQNLAMVDEKKRVLVLTGTTEGKKHDKKMLDEEELITAIPEEIEVEVDLGFQGVQKPRENVKIPHKKPIGGELTEEQKQENRELSSSRGICEHAFAGIKRYNAVSTVYRNRVTNFDDRLMLVTTGLWNFDLEAA